jgi:hypothetical protein
MRHWSKIKHEAKVSFLFTLFVLGAPAMAKMSMGVQFPDIVLEKLDLGAAYNLRQLKGIPYVVMNKSDVPLDIQVEVQVPQKKDLKEGYEAIPDTRWLKVLPNKFRLEAGDVAPADVILAIPADASLSGRHFQAHLHARSAGAGMLQIGVMHMIRFSVGSMGPDSLKQEAQAQTQALISLDVDLSPQTLQAGEVALGRPVDLKKEKAFSFKLSNRGDQPLSFKVTPFAVDARLKGGLGAEAGDPAWLTVKPAKIKIKSNRIEDLVPVLNIPDVPENRGKKFLFAVSLELEGLDMPFQMIGKLLVTTK